MDSNQNFLIPIYVAVALALGVFLGDFMSRGLEGDKLKNYQSSNKLFEVFNILDENYVDDFNKDSLLTTTINDLLHKLDPHSNYIPTEEVARMRENIEGKFGGIGVRFFILRDTICVSNVINNTPAQSAGIKSGDKIIAVNDKNVASVSISNDEIMNNLKGPSGTPVKLTLLRGKDIYSVDFNRGSIPIKTVSSFYMIDSITGFIQINQFSIPTNDEFVEAAKTLLSKNMKNLILDLRNNGGGVMESAVQIVDEFLPSGQLIVSAKGKNFKQQDLFSSHRGLLKDIPLIILINNYSASASEIVAGAIQDNDRGLIVGRTSFGKGLIQEDREMEDGSQLRVTVARYYTPSGRCIQRPYSNLTYEEYISLGNSSAYMNKDSIETFFPDSLKYKTVYKNRTVYGGGGIFPDHSVRYDTIEYSDFFLNARFVGAFTSYAFDFLEDKRNNWSSMEDFMIDPQIQNISIRDFYTFCFNEYGLFSFEDETPKNEHDIKTWIIAEIARQIWTENGYYKIVNQYDPYIKMAKSILNDLNLAL